MVLDLNISKLSTALKLSQACKPIKNLNKIIIKTKRILFVKDIVMYLLRHVNRNGKFFNIYKFIVSQIFLVTTWFEIKNKIEIFIKSDIEITHKINVIVGRSILKRFQQISELLTIEKYDYILARTLKIKKKNAYVCQKFLILNLYEKIIQKTFYKVLKIIFEGYFEWEKLNKKFLKTDSSKLNNYVQMFKVKNSNEYWIKKYKIKPIFSFRSHNFLVNKGIHSIINLIKCTWHPVWLASFNICNILNSINVNIIIKKLQNYIDDEQLIRQLKKMFNMQLMNYKLEIQKNILYHNSFLSLLFNFYLYFLDKFIEKTIKNIIWTNLTKVNLENKKIINKYLKYWNMLSRKSRYKIIKKSKTKSFLNDSTKMPIRLYYVRYNKDFMLGFSMTKIQTKLILENVNKFIINDLKLKVNFMILKHIITDKLFFLGFIIQTTSSKIINCHSKNKKLEAYKRHKNVILKRGAHEYEKFLKMIEWLGRKAIVSIVQKTKTSKKYFVKEKELKNVIPNVVQDKNWFYKKHDLNRKLKLAFQIRYENQQYRLKKWIKASQDLTNSREIIELAKMIGNDQVNRLNNIRKNMMNLLNDLIKPKTEKAYILKKELIKKKSTIISFDDKNISKLEIFFPKRQIIENLKNKGIVNFKGMPSVPMHKMMLPVYQIINWYVNILKGLVFYYCCVTNLTSLKRLINWILRYSLLATIGVKHKKSIKWTIENFGFNPKIVYKNKIIANFPAAGWINSRKKEYLKKMWSNINSYSKIKNERIQFNQKIMFFEKFL